MTKWSCFSTGTRVGRLDFEFIMTVKYVEAERDIQRHRTIYGYS
jgi:hypothetical protein